jgi:amidase
MSLQAELAYRSATELAALVRQRVLSPVELLEAAIERIEERNPSLNAFVHTGFEEAREQAREAQRQLVSGAELGPLHGVPTAIKDLFDFKPGWPSTYGGIRALKDNIVGFSCPWCERIERAGAIVVGKTNSPIMGYRGTCDNYLFGPTRNPFDVSKNTGGSSGGSAAAVADGMLAFAEGTDGGGSVRIPAAWCNVFGFKQSLGRVPFVARPNAFLGTNPFLFEGIISRTVEDAALALGAISGYDARDPLSFPSAIDATAAVRRSCRGMRIAFSPDLDVYPVEASVASVVRAAAQAFEELGAHVEEVKVGIERDQRELSDVWSRMILPVNIEAIESLKSQGIDLLSEHREDLPPQYLRRIEEGYRLGALDVARDQQIRTEIFDAFQSLFGRYDLLVTPTLACNPVDNARDGNTTGPSVINGVEVDELIGWCLTYLTNFTGHPSASIPAGMACGRYPVGLQIIGRMLGDEDVLAASAAFERLRPWCEAYEICRTRALQPVAR